MSLRKSLLISDCILVWLEGCNISLDVGLSRSNIFHKHWANKFKVREGKRFSFRPFEMLDIFGSGGEMEEVCRTWRCGRKKGSDGSQRTETSYSAVSECFTFI